MWQTPNEKEKKPPADLLQCKIDFDHHVRMCHDALTRAEDGMDDDNFSYVFTQLEFVKRCVKLAFYQADLASILAMHHAQEEEKKNATKARPV
jgi:hypothetical protein